jgi:hypothetical protein
MAHYVRRAWQSKTGLIMSQEERKKRLGSHNLSKAYPQMPKDVPLGPTSSGFPIAPSWGTTFNTWAYGEHSRFKFISITGLVSKKKKIGS